MTTKTIASVGLALILTVLAANSAEARTRHHRQIDTAPVIDHRHDVLNYDPSHVAVPRVRYSRRTASGPSSSLADTLRENVRLVRQQADEIEKMRHELAEIRQQLSPNAAAVLAVPPGNPVLASISPLTPEAPVEQKPSLPRHVFPATAIQRGQFNDRRRTHRHAGIDLGGVYGSPIVASFAGVVLPPPGGDRGYGPHCLVVRGDDGLVYRYAHMAKVTVKIGQRVDTGQQIGTMGKVGRHGFVHLHFEMMRVAEYRRRPYGVHKLDPNDYLGGARGRTMVAGVAMTGEQARAYAAQHTPSKVADAP